MDIVTAQAVDVLLHAKDIVLDGWTKGALAKDGEGRNVDITNENVEAVCTAGAIIMALKTIDQNHVDAVRSQIACCLTPLLEGQPGAIFGFNDAPVTTKEDVINLFEEAVTRLKDGNFGEDVE